ncbi:hypothetical protein ILUMI_22789 [Ignelater luminosus]|uniref:UDP-glucuronosyltransferase n=1 Tax=Ignelater luminosus TaxID=2038154 RepID=A0A8K0CDR4_IGNLU|nr:hypothetical protein ILUMI_22789 [Ignelater luminosus]
MLKLLLFFNVIRLCLYSVDSYKILGIFPVPSISHQIVFQPIWKELSLRGHEVTVITPNPLNDKSLVNLTEIDVSFSYKIFIESNLQESITKDVPVNGVVDFIFTLMLNIIEAQLKHPEVQALIQDKDKHFDLVMVEFLNPAVYAFSARFQCPLIGMTSLGALLGGHDAVGNPSHPLLHSDFFLPSTGELSFFDRVYNTMYTIWYRYNYYYNVLPHHDKLVKKYIGDDLPYLGDIERNVSMLFINENSIFHSIKPNVPAVIELSNMHIKKKKPLPKDLQNELDTATEGVVYFSLGSNVRSANLSEHLREQIIGALSEVPYKIIWKWEDDYLPGQPKNVIIRPWLPQQDILGHPNIKVFVTQGGQQSAEEAIYYGVPLVGMPFFGDQFLITEKIANLGIAHVVNPETLTKQQLKAAIVEVAENSKYREKAKEMSALSLDMPLTGLEKAIWWTEYVIRHKGARHLRSPVLNIPWYQYVLLDVIGFILLVCLIVTFVLYKIILLGIKGRQKYSRHIKLKVS